MKRLIWVILSMTICISLFGCGTMKSSNTGIFNNLRDKDALIYDAVDKFYSNREPKNKGDLKIYSTKSFKEKYLVLAEKYSGDGHRFSHLFLIDEKYNIKEWTTGEIPISNCFSINRAEYSGNTILFGTFNNSKWDSKKDKKIPVKIDNIYVSLDDNEEIREEVSGDNCYILILDSNSKVEKVQLYNDKGEVQSSLADGIEIIDTQFMGK